MVTNHPSPYKQPKTGINQYAFPDTTQIRILCKKHTDSETYNKHAQTTTHTRNAVLTTEAHRCLCIVDF